MFDPVIEIVEPSSKMLLSPIVFCEVNFEIRFAVPLTPGVLSAYDAVVAKLLVIEFDAVVA